MDYHCITEKHKMKTEIKLMKEVDEPYKLSVWDSHWFLCLSLFIYIFFLKFLKKYKYLDEYSILRKLDDINTRRNKCEAFSRNTKWNVMNKSGTFEEIMLQKNMWILFQNVNKHFGYWDLSILVFEILIPFTYFRVKDLEIRTLSKFYFQLLITFNANFLLMSKIC